MARKRSRRGMKSATVRTPFMPSFGMKNKGRGRKRGKRGRY